MDSTTHSKNKTSSEVAAESVANSYYVIAVEFPDEDKKAYVMSDSFLFPNCIKKFDNKEDAHSYAIEQFPNFIHYIEKIN